MDKNEVDRMTLVTNELVDWFLKGSFHCPYHPDDKQATIKCEFIAPSEVRATAYCGRCKREGTLGQSGSPLSVIDIPIPPHLLP